MRFALSGTRCTTSRKDRTMPCTEVRHRVLQMENHTAVLGDGLRSSLQVMQETNPYKPLSEFADLHVKGGLGRNHCPSCSHPVSRWRVWNTIASRRCSNCGEKLWLELKSPSLMFLVTVGNGFWGFWWLFQSPTKTSVFMFYIGMPFLMVGVRCWMKVAFGKLRSTNQSSL